MKRILPIIIALMCMLPMWGEKIDKRTAVESILRAYPVWHNAEFTGRLNVKELPLRPTIKIYMERGKLIQISARVPMLGEVARIDVSEDSILAVNKLKRTYILESTERLRDAYPWFISDLQSLLLGRMVVVGHGEFSLENARIVEIDTSDAEEWIVVPQQPSKKIDASYGYNVTPRGRITELLAEMPSLDMILRISYHYAGAEMSMDVAFNKGKKETTFSIDFDRVRWGGTMMQPVKGLSRMKRLGIREIKELIRM